MVATLAGAVAGRSAVQHAMATARARSSWLRSRQSSAALPPHREDSRRSLGSDVERGPHPPGCDPGFRFPGNQKTTYFAGFSPSCRLRAGRAGAKIHPSQGRDGRRERIRTRPAEGPAPHQADGSAPHSSPIARTVRASPPAPKEGGPVADRAKDSHIAAPSGRDRSRRRGSHGPARTPHGVRRGLLVDLRQPARRDYPGSGGRGAFTTAWNPAPSSTNGSPGAGGGRSTPCSATARLAAPCSATCLSSLR
jgi:hypothetical protein